MATDPSQRILFTPYTSFPMSLDMATAVPLRLLSNVEVFFQVTSLVHVTGVAWLLKWIPEANAWWPYRNPIVLDSADPLIVQGKYHASWFNDRDRASYFQLLISGAFTLGPAYMQGVRYDG